MMRSFTLALLFTCCQLQGGLAQSNNKLDNAIRVIVLFCVAGGEKVDISGSAGDGGLALGKPNTSGSANITISKSEMTGLVDGLQREMTKLSADQASEARKCMQPYINRILSMLDDGSAPRPTPSVIETTSSFLQKVAISRWCTSKRAYSLQVSGHDIVWKDSFGSVDMERVVYNNVSDAQTVTQKSIHTDGDGVPAGTTWTYVSSGPDKINVSKNGGKAFLLTRC